MLADKDARVVSLAGDITWQNAPALSERLNTLVRQGHRSLIINLGSVDYIDSSGLAMFITLSRHMRKIDGNLLLIDVGEAVIRALQQACLIDYIPVVGKNVAHHDNISILPPDESALMVRTIHVPGDPSCMSEVRHDAAKLFASLQLSRETTYDLVLALGEALGNAFDHGGGSECTDGSVTATVRVYRDRVVMEVTDCGCGCHFKLGDPLPESSELRGRGIKLMVMLTDSIEIVPRASGQGACVRMVKLIDVPVQMESVNQ